MSLRGRLVALGLAITVVLAGGVVVLLTSRTPGCAVASPRPALPDALRALGDFDQAYDSSDVASLQDAAVRAAGALHGDLIGAVPQQPVRIAPTSPSATTAVVVPLRAPSAAGQLATPLDGLVLFLLDCRSGAYFATVEDDAALQPPLLAFPPVSWDAAAAQLGSSAVRLEYQSSPLHPVWVSTSPRGGSLPAR